MIIQQPGGIDPGTFVTDPAGYPAIAGISFFDVDGATPAGSWKNVRVADWSALSNVPVDADWIVVRSRQQVLSNSGANGILVCYARKAGAALPAGADTVIAEVAGDANTTRWMSNVCYPVIPLNPSAGLVEFDITWIGSGVANQDIRFRLVGYGRNP